jgi:glycosyltransferase involved in cell wall biosynthesis
LAVPNVRFVSCFGSNENVLLRIGLQQTVLPAQIKRHKVDVLFSPGNVCPLVGNFCRVLKINTLHHYVTPALIGRTRALYRRAAFALSARSADHIIANTTETKSEICRWMGVAEPMVSVVWEASYSAFMPMTGGAVQAACERHGLRPGYVLFVSALYPYKNADSLVRAYARLRAAGQIAGQLVILGRDFERQQAKLQALARECGIERDIIFPGFVDLADLPSLYCGARVFVYPSLLETFGKPLVEAMQSGVPIVASSTSCIPEVVGDAALLVDPRNIEEMSAAIHRAWSDEPLRAQLVARGLRRGKLFTWENAAQQILEVITRTHSEWKTQTHGAAAKSASV